LKLYALSRKDPPYSKNDGLAFNEAGPFCFAISSMYEARGKFLRRAELLSWAFMRALFLGTEIDPGPASEPVRSELIPVLA
jgi:hypothetical protein